jgi:phospholipase C
MPMQTLADGVSRRRVLGAGLGVAALAAAAPSPDDWSHHPPRQPGSLPHPDLPEGTDTIPQIEHIIVVMMENHSYDNRLGMLHRPGADGFRLGRHGLPRATNPYPDGRVQHAFHMPTTCQLPAQPAQDWPDSHIQYDGGRNDGFVRSGSGPVAMGYWQRADQPFYYSLVPVGIHDALRAGRPHHGRAAFPRHARLRHPFRGSHPVPHGEVHLHRQPHDHRR